MTKVTQPVLAADELTHISDDEREREREREGEREGEREREGEGGREREGEGGREREGERGREREGGREREIKINKDATKNSLQEVTSSLLGSNRHSREVSQELVLGNTLHFPSLPIPDRVCHRIPTLTPTCKHRLGLTLPSQHSVTVYPVSNSHFLVVQQHSVHFLYGHVCTLLGLKVHKTVALGNAMLVHHNLHRQVVSILRVSILIVSILIVSILMCILMQCLMHSVSGLNLPVQ